MVNVKNRLFRGFFKPNQICGFLISAIVCLTYALKYSEIAKNHTVNIFEPYLTAFNGKNMGLVILMGSIIVFADAPFVDENTFMQVHRSGRRKWYRSNWYYIIIRTILFYLSLFIVSVLPFVTRGYYENRWSQCMMRMSRTMTKHMAKIGISGLNEMVMDNTPVETFIYTFILSALYTIIMAGILYALNMRLNKNAIGTIAVGVIHVISFLLTYQMGLNSALTTKLLLFRNAIYPYGYNPEFSSGIFSVLYLTTMVYVVYVAGDMLLKNMDFSINS